MSETDYPEISDAFVDQLFADMKRLGARVYPEEGIPMFLVAEDMSASAAETDGRTSPNGVLLASAFAQIIAGLKQRKPDLDAGDIASAVELLADRYFLAFAVPPFSQIEDLHPAGSNN